MRRSPFEDDARVQISEAAELERVVGRLEAHDERRLVDERHRLEDARERVLGRAELLAREEQHREVVRERRPAAAQRASSIMTARPPFMSLAPSPTTEPSGEAARQVAWAGTVSVWPASNTSGLPLALRVDQRLAVVVDAGSRRTLRRTYSYSAASDRETDGMLTSASALSATVVAPGLRA